MEFSFIIIKFNDGNALEEGTAALNKAVAEGWIVQDKQFAAAGWSHGTTCWLLITLVREKSE